MNIVRKATERDADQIGFVHYQAWMETYAGMLPESMLAGRSKEKSIAMFDKTKCKNIVVACADDFIAGFCGWGAMRSELPQKSVGEIYGIYILRAYQGLHLGQEMMQYALKELKRSGCKQAGLWVLDANRNAIDFYEKLGFSYSGTSKNVNLGKQITELLYTKKL